MMQVWRGMCSAPELLRDALSRVRSVLPLSVPDADPVGARRLEDAPCGGRPSPASPV